MSEIHTNGNWQPNPGGEQTFVEVWTKFAGRTGSRLGAATPQPAGDLNGPGRFVSFGHRETIDRVRDWKSSPEFREHTARVLSHAGEFTPAELAPVATAQAGATTTITRVGVA